MRDQKTPKFKIPNGLDHVSYSEEDRIYWEEKRKEMRKPKLKATEILNRK